MVHEVREAEELVRGRRLLERLAGPRPEVALLDAVAVREARSRPGPVALES